MMLLQDLGNSQPDVGVWPKRIEEQFSGNKSFPLQSPNINFFLAVCKCAVARIQAIFSNSHLCNTQGQILLSQRVLEAKSVIKHVTDVPLKINVYMFSRDK